MAQKISDAEKTYASVHEWRSTRSDGKHKSSREIESDMDSTRYEMDRTMSEISKRFQTRAMIDHVLDYFNFQQNRENARAILRDVRKSAAESVRQNPGPLLLIGGGLAWLLLKERRQYGRAGRESPNAYGPLGSEVDGRTGEAYPTDRETGEPLSERGGIGRSGGLRR